MRRTRPAALAALAFCSLAPSRAPAQVVAGEVVPPGETVATTTDANAARVNMGAVALVSGTSARFTHVSELRRGNTTLDADALSITTPLFLGFAGSLGLRWQRPAVDGYRGHVVSAELGLGYAFTRRLGLGARVRLTGAGGDPGLAPLASTAALDLGVAWRLSPWFAVGLSGTNLLGPRVRTLGVEPTAIAGVGFRPTGTDALTAGLDGAVGQSGDGWVRAGLRARVPYVGYVRAEGVLDLPARAWRAGAGLELVWDEWSAGGGAFLGGDSSAAGGTGPLGFYATAGLDSDRGRGLPTPATVVSIEIENALGGRSLARTLLKLERLRRDPAVRGVVFAPRDDVQGLANAEELREAFARLRASGKRVVCHLLTPSGSTYYACADADRIVMDPAGALRSAGVRQARYFLGDTLRMLGVRTEFVRIGAWKSAPEQFTRSGSTPAARAQEDQLMDDYYAALVGGIGRGRGWGAAHAREVVEAGPYTASEARRAGLIDALGPRESAEQWAARALDARVVDLDDWSFERGHRWAAGGSVVVYHIDGDIVEGESFEVPFVGMKFVGNRSVSEDLARLASDPRVRAVVLRIDSGGGSAVSGELIWRAVARLAARKPVVASFGSIAASAAYYIAMGAQENFADASSLTGSIGIFYGKVDLSTLLGRLGVRLELARRGPRADYDTLFRPLRDDERAVIARHIDEFYQVFLRRVAHARGMSPAAVNAVAEGRVFAGVRAHSLRLVDHVGGLLSAVDRARALADLDESADVVELPADSGGLLGTLTTLLFSSASSPSPEPMARLIEQSELSRAVGWLFTLGFAGGGHMMAMTDWPIDLR